VLYRSLELPTPDRRFGDRKRRTSPGFGKVVNRFSLGKSRDGRWNLLEGKDKVDMII
jgi:hypothetical protein